MNLSCSTAALITPLRLRPSYASDRCQFSKTERGHDNKPAARLNTSMCDELTDLRCLLRGCHRVPVYRYKILHVGTRHALAEHLNQQLQALDCSVEYCSILWHPHVFLKSDMKYALLLVDEQLGETTGAEFTQFVRSLPHRRDLPIMAVKTADDFNVLAQMILSLLSPNAEAA